MSVTNYHQACGEKFALSRLTNLSLRVHSITCGLRTNSSVKQRCAARGKLGCKNRPNYQALLLLMERLRSLAQTAIDQEGRKTVGKLV